MGRGIRFKATRRTGFCLCGSWNSAQTLRSRRKLVDGNPLCLWRTLWSGLDEAAAALQKHLAANPSSLDALNLLQLVQWRRLDNPSYLQATVQLCQFHLKAPDFDAAWKTFEEFNTGSVDKMPAATWLELNRNLESQQNFERAVAEYERLVAAPAQKESLLALLSAGRICLRKLNRPADAMRNYKAAQASTVPQLDWEANISMGIQVAERAQPSATSTLK